MSFIITSDTHFSPNSRDEYRWGLLPWLKAKAIEYQVSQVIICGDLCQEKDSHPSSLVNRLVKGLADLAEVCDLLILKGNHDFVAEDSPFFGFVDEFKSNITFISKITSYKLMLGNKQINCLFLPCTRNWQKDWQGLDFTKYDLLLTHQTYDGSIAETGVQLPGIPLSVFKGFKGKLFSGDIHMPQKIGKYGEFCGSPFHIRFGDNFRPRVILYGDDATIGNLHYDCLSKHVISGSSVDDILEQGQKVKKGDQVKIRISLPRAELPTWPELKVQIRDQAIGLGWELLGLELLAIKETLKPSEPTSVYKHSDEILADFIKAKKLSQKQAEIGLSLIKGV